MKILIIGAGKVGYYLTKTLVEHGHQPSVIEMDRSLCQTIANDLDIPVICGDGTTLSVLEDGSITKCDAVISVTGRDEVNLVACQLAKKHFSVPKTVARVNNPKNLSIMRQLGVDIPISSTDRIARMLEREVDTAMMKELLPLGGDSTLTEIQIPKPYHNDGVTLSKLKLTDECVVVSVMRQGQLIIPRGNTEIRGGDKIVIVCRSASLHEIMERLGLDL